MTASDISPQAPLALRSDVVVAVLDEGAVLLDLESNYFYSANHGAWAIIQLIDAGVALQDVPIRCRQFGAGDEDMAAVAAVVALLRDDGLLANDGGDVGGAEPEAVRWSPPLLEKHRDPLQKIMVSAFDPSLPLAE